MLFSPEINRAPHINFNQPAYQAVENATYIGREDPSLEHFQSFKFEQTIIALEGGNYSLRLVKPLNLLMSPDAISFRVVDWGIELETVALPDLPREIARRFLKLLNKAEMDVQTEPEQVDWMRILDYV